MHTCLHGSKWITLQRFTKFDHVTGGQEIKKLPFLLNFNFLSRYFVSLVNMCSLSSLLAIFFSYFKIIKQSPGHDHGDTKYLLGPQCPF